MHKPRILECTLRDGSYAINFQFTKEQTKLIAGALERVGFDMIEVGHGIGLGAVDKGFAVAAETDAAYLEAAAESLTTADWGMFCIPGIATLDHVELAAKYGMKFIRVGVAISEVEKAKPFVELAKKHGMFVCSNFMKSYVSTPAEFTSAARYITECGADVVYLVDSAGGMLPEDIACYADYIKQENPEIKLGFHGHNNLGLGVANALKAAELGFDIVDTSLQGMGRSAGNTPTEQFICALMRYGVELDFDPVAVMEVAEKYIRPLIETNGVNSLDITAGLSLFHSSYMPVVREYAQQYKVDPRRLIIAVCKHDQLSAPKELVAHEAERLSEFNYGNWKALYGHYYGEEQDKTAREKGRMSAEYVTRHFASLCEGDQFAVVTSDGSYTYKALFERVFALVSVFAQQGNPASLVLAIKLPNGFDYLSCFLAAAFGGFTVVPLSPELSDSEIAYILKTARVSLLVDARFMQTVSEFSAKAELSFEPSLFEASEAIFFTSGTTGKPKGVCHKMMSLFNNVASFNNLLGIDHSIAMLHVLPMGYMAGLLNTVLSPLMAGGCVIIADKFSAMSALSFWQTLIKTGANAVWITPTIAAILLKLDQGNEVRDWLSENLNYVFVGTAPFPQAVKDDFEQAFSVKCLESYGMTEVMLVSCQLPEDSANQFSYLLPGVEASVDRENSELQIRSSACLSGYLDPSTGKPDLREEGGWFKTGDLAEIDEGRRLKIVGRQKDCIIRGGKNISPVFVENKLLQFNGICEVSVFGVAHEAWGEEVVAALVIDNAFAGENELRDFCSQALSREMSPSQFVFLKSLPKTLSGKVNKEKLRRLVVREESVE